MTDEIIYRACVISDNRHNGDNYIGSQALLCSRFYKNKNLFFIAVRVLIDSFKNGQIFNAKYRFSKEPPRDCKVFFAKHDGAYVYILSEEKTTNYFQDKLSTINRLTFYIYLNSDSRDDYKLTFDVSSYKQLAPVLSKRRLK